MKKLLKNLMYGSLLALPYGTFAQTFTETFGSVSGTSSIATASVGFSTAGIPFTYTGTADVRNTTPSNTYALASGTPASGAANVFFTNTVGRVFEISGINTTAVTSPVINFGISKSTNADNASGMIVEYAVGTSTVYTALSFPVLPTGSNTSQTNWFARQTVGTIPSTTNLRLRFRQNSSTVQYRIDDVQLATAGSTTTPCSTTATITASGATTLCNGSSVVLTSSSAASYTWSNGANTPSISVNQSGTYNVTVTAVGGCTATASATRVLVYPTPIVGASATNICGSGTSTITARTFAPDLIITEYSEGPTGNEKFVEIFNGTGAAISNLSGYEYHAFQNGSSVPTIFSLATLSIADNGVLVLRNPGSTASLLPAGVPSTTVNAVMFNGNDAVGLFKTGVGGGYVDIFGVIGQNPGTAWTGTGGYTTVDATLRRKSSVYSGITVNPALPGAGGFTTLVPEWDLLPASDLTGFGAHTMDGTYSWSAGTTPFTGNVVTASPPASSVYTVTGSYGVSGCSNTGTVQVNVFDSPIIAINNPGAIKKCYGPQCITLDVFVVSGTPTQYLWSTGATTQSISVCPVSTTNYSVIATDANGCTAVESTDAVVIDACCGVSGDSVIVCTGTTTVCMDSLEVEAFLADNEEAFVGPCDARMAQATAVAEMANVSGLNVYPNPFSEATVFEVKLNAASPVKIEIMDITGKKVAELVNATFEAGSHQFNWNGTNAAGNVVSNGLYFCKIATGEQVKTIKVQKLSDK